MIVLNCNEITLSFGVNKILDSISFRVMEGDKIGVVGVNGAGKSTLFKILSGNLQPDSGDIFLARGFSCAFLEQNSGLDSSSSIWEELISVYSHLTQMEKRLKDLELSISRAAGSPELDSLMKEYAFLSDKFESLDGYTYNSRVRGVLRGLGFDDSQFNEKISILSGGQKTRLALARLLLEEPDILLMDEPTNHLDIKALEWLEDFLRNYKKSVLLISHDRYFLDAVTNKTLEIENTSCKMYNGSYSKYITQKAEDREIQKRHYEQQQKEIKRLEEFIEQQRRWNREKNIIAAESRQKAIDRMEKVERPSSLPDKVRIKFRSSIISGNDVLFVENLSKEFPGKPLFENVNFRLRRTERVFLLGPNGSGKSTLLKILAGVLEKTSGEFEYGHKIKLGFYDQEHQNLNEASTVIEEVWETDEKLTRTEIGNALAAFLFKGEDVFKPISVLSGGERGRVSLVKLMLSGANFILLDEPTNHLDINSREALEEALSSFDGTILAVSHDRYFINKLASRILEMNSSTIFDYGGDYSFYLEHRQKLSSDSNEAEDGGMSISKMERIASKEVQARARRLEKRLSETEREIEQTEARITAIAEEMCDEAVFSDHVAIAKLHEEDKVLKKKLDELYVLWDELSSQQEQA